MNVSQTPQQQISVIEFISTTGQHKTMTSLAGTETIRAIRADALESLSHFQCVVCEDVHSKPLRARCCDAILCAFCYNHLETPKACPNDREPFFNTLSRDLIPMGRPVYKQIEHLIRHFTDIEATGTDTTKSEAQQLALATLEGRPASGTAIPESSPAVSHAMDINTVPVVGTILPFGGRTASAVPSAGAWPLSNNSLTEDPLTSALVVLRQRALNFGAPPRHCQVTDYPLDRIRGLDISTNDGNVVLAKQLLQHQDTVTVTAATDPEIRSNGFLKIAPRGPNGNVTVKLPQAFDQPLNIFNSTGDVITRNSYRIKRGGSIVATFGNICIAVDSTRVEVVTMGPDSEVTVAYHNEPLGPRTELSVRSWRGKIKVTD